jgi:hypothetical protein
MSRNIDGEVRILATAGPGGNHGASAALDVAVPHARRQQWGLANLLARLPLAAFSAGYAAGRRRASGP